MSTVVQRFADAIASLERAPSPVVDQIVAL